MKRLIVALAAVAALASCGFPRTARGVTVKKDWPTTTTTEGGVHVEICPPFCGDNQKGQPVYCTVPDGCLLNLGASTGLRVPYGGILGWN